MKHTSLFVPALGILLAAALMGCHADKNPFSDASVETAADAAVEWQVGAYPRMNDMRVYKSDGDLSWQNATFLFSLMSWASYTGNTELFHWGCNIADTNRYELSRAQRIYHADDLVIGSFYARVFAHTGDTAELRPTYERLCYIVEHPSEQGLDLDYSRPETLERWSWCDALFMAPPVFAEYARIFNDYRLMSYMDHEYWATVDHLYSSSDSLFFRDSGYFQKREANGEKIFWGRGNAWVIAGLARTIPLLYDDMRKPYEQLFTELAARLVALQQPDGSWHASLLDPDSYPAPESSATGLIAYALWWGINYGILDEATYLPHAEAAWKALLANQLPSGMLGYVQPIGADPREGSYSMTEVYGAAAMALTAVQIMEHNRIVNGIGRDEEAELLMDKTPFSVMMKKEAPRSGDMHDYMSIARYSWPDPNTPDGLPYIHRDGETNPEIADYDRVNLGTTAERIITLARAYKRTGNERYARKAAEFIRVWFLSRSTRMKPNLRFSQVVKGENGNYGRPYGVIDVFSFVEMLEVIPFLEKSEAFTSSDARGLRLWFRDMLHWMETTELGEQAGLKKNNISVAYDVERIAFASFTGQHKKARQIAEAFAERRIFAQIEPDGSMPEELKRTRAYHYSEYNLSMMVQACRWAEREGVDLYHAKSADGRSIGRAIQYMLRYTGGEPWPYNQLDGMDDTQCSFSNLAMGFSHHAAINQNTVLREWEFRRGDEGKWEKVTIPHSCNAIDGQSEHYYRGDAFYRTTIEAQEGKTYRLLFHQAGQRATVYVNGREVADHFGGYTPFTVCLDNVLHSGDNEILVRCNNEMDLTMAPVSSDFNKNNGLYGNVILQTVERICIASRQSGVRGMLISTPAVSPQEAEVCVRTWLDNIGGTDEHQILVSAFLRGECGRILAQATDTIDLAKGEQGREVALTMHLAGPRLWQGLSDPHLYRLDLIIHDGENIFEHRRGRFGIRTVEARNDGFYLNGKPYQLRGFSYHQDRYGRASALTEQDLREDFLHIQDLGCTVLRLAHYPHSEYAFDLCDSLGILVQTEIPWVNECGADTSRYSQQLYADHLLQAWDEMIIGHYNHPSIAFWGMWNELGGSHAGRPQGDLDRAFLVRMSDTLYRRGKELDPGRIIGFADMGFGLGIPELKQGRNYDYLGCNKYLGWYQDQQSPLSVAGIGGFMDYVRKQFGPCAVTEYGAGCSPFCHTEDPVLTTNPATGGARHDEEWFNTLHENAVAQIRQRPWLLFTSAWVLFDFAVADRREGYITCTDGLTEGVDSTKLYINDKGIITRDRRLRKDAFYLYQAWWHPMPTVYITQRRYTCRPTDSIALRVYSNAETLTLYQNGRPVQTIRAAEGTLRAEGSTLQKRKALSTSNPLNGLVWEFDPIPFIRPTGHTSDFPDADADATTDAFRVEGSFPGGRCCTDVALIGHK